MTVRLYGDCLFQVTEELEKVKLEMEERGSSMTDGGKSLLQTHRYFVSPTLQQKHLANTVSPTVLQSNGICSLLTSITFNPLTVKTALKTHFYKQYYK